MSVRALGWIVLAVGAVLLLVSPVFDHPWSSSQTRLPLAL